MRYSSSPIQSDVRSCQGDVRYSYAHKFVMCGDVRFSGTPVSYCQYALMRTKKAKPLERSVLTISFSK